jgi:hypothetical protein
MSGERRARRGKPVGMRTAGFAPSLGAGGSLVAASVVVALLASALLAFRDRPSGAPHAGAGTATLPSAATPRTHRSAAPVVARGSAAAARRARRSAPTAGSAPRPAAGPRRPVPASSLARTSLRSAPATTHAPARHLSPPAAKLPAPTLTATGPVGATVHTVRKVVDPVVKRLAPPVQAPVNGFGDTVQHVGDSVDGALGNAEIRLP